MNPSLLAKVRTCREILASLTASFDLVRLDADRRSYLTYLDAVLRLLRRGGLLVTDNVTSHAQELRGFLDRVKRDPTVATMTVPLGEGEELTCQLP